MATDRGSWHTVRNGGCEVVKDLGPCHRQTWIWISIPFCPACVSRIKSSASWGRREESVRDRRQPLAVAPGPLPGLRLCSLWALPLQEMISLLGTKWIWDLMLRNVGMCFTKEPSEGSHRVKEQREVKNVTLMDSSCKEGSSRNGMGRKHSLQCSF